MSEKNWDRRSTGLTVPGNWGQPAKAEAGTTATLEGVLMAGLFRDRGPRIRLSG